MTVGRRSWTAGPATAPRRPRSSSTTTASPSGSAACATAWTGCADARAARRRVAPYPSPLVRDAPARRRRGPAGRAGAARSREPGHDPDLHPRLADAPSGGVSGGAPPGASRPRLRDLGPQPGAGGTDRLRRVPRVARPGLGPDGRHRPERRFAHGTRLVLRGVPHPGPDLPARGRGRALVGADPDRVRPVRHRRAPTGLARRLDGHQPDADRPGCPGSSVCSSFGRRPSSSSSRPASTRPRPRRPSS